MVFVVVERRCADPMVALGLLADRRFVGFAVAAGALMGILVPLVVYLPSYLISVVGMEPGRPGCGCSCSPSPPWCCPRPARRRRGRGPWRTKSKESVTDW